MRNSNRNATPVQGTALATSTGNDLPKNQKVIFKCNSNIYTVNNAERVLYELFTLEYNNLKNKLLSLSIAINDLEDKDLIPDASFLSLINSFFSELEANLTVENKENIVAKEYEVKYHSLLEQLKDVRIELAEARKKQIELMEAYSNKNN